LLVTEMGERRSSVDGPTYHIGKIHPSLRVRHDVLAGLIVLLISLLLLDGALDHEHERLGDGRVAIFDDAVPALLARVLAALEAHGPAPAVARRVLRDGARGENPAELAVDRGERNSDGGGHGGRWWQTATRGIGLL
jgi:hypothetical protein